MDLRYRSALALISVMLLPACASERHFAADSWPFGNPNAPTNSSETAERALGHAPAITPISPQPGNVWPGPVQPMPTLADVEKNMNEPLGEADTPALPSPYPLDQDPHQRDGDSSGYSIPPATPAPAQ